MKSYKWVTREEMERDGFTLDAELEEPPFSDNDGSPQNQPGSPPPKERPNAP